MRRAWKSAGVAVALAALGLGYLADDVRRNMRYDAQLSWVDGSCTLLATPTPCEDMSALGDGHSAFAGGGDIWKAFEHGSEGVADGAVWLVNATAGVVRKLEVDAPAGLPKLVLHGVYYSQSSRRLYAVNHDEASGESVEVFEVEGEGDALRLRHAHSVRSPLFGNFALNDVVEGGAADEFYVTEWQPFPMPARGKAAAKDAPWRVRLGRALIVPIAMLKIRTTRVLRCTLRGAPASPACEVASASRWVMANGIAISADRRSVFVNDPVTRTVTVLERDGLTGALTAVSQFGTKHTLDNIEMDATGALTGGSIPLPYTSESVCDEAKDLSATKVVGGRTVGCGSSPGGLLRISLLGTGGRSYVAGAQADLTMHDGSKLSGVASAVALGRKVVLGSPNSPGLLVCDAAS